MKNPQKWSEAPVNELSRIRGVAFDIDDTLSTQGKLEAIAYQCLWDLHNAGYCLVAVTGRPAGWCDHIARFWPVHAVIGENGAFSTFLSKDSPSAPVKRKTFYTPDRLSESVRKSKLAKLKSEIEKHFTKATCASDQHYREFDLAIDISEDVKPWSKKEIDRLLAFCKSRGAHAKLSSIHVNIWYGEYDKQKGFNYWLKKGSQGLGVTQVPKKLTDWLYIGDSPNDEPLFEFFPNSLGVANLNPYLNRLKNKPRWITKAKSGNGFAEMARALLNKRC